MRPALRARQVVPLCVCLCWLPLPAHAALTSRVDGLEAALNAAWAADPRCQTLLVDDLVGQGDQLLLTTTRPLAFRLSEAASATAACSSHGWQLTLAGEADASSGACAQLACQVLETHGELAPRLHAAMEHARSSEENVLAPHAWTPPGPTPSGVVWLIWSAATLLLPLALLFMRRRRPSPPVGPVPRAADWAVLMVIALAGVAVRYVMSQHAEISLDERFCWGSDSLWRDFDGREMRMNPPLYRLISYPLTSWTNGDPGVARFFAMGLGAVLVLAVGRLGVLLGGRWTGVVAALLAAAHPGLVLATMYHRSYALLVPATALALLATETAVRSGRTVDRYLAASLAAATVLSHYFGVGVVVGLGLRVLLAERGRWKAWLGPAALTAFLLMPFVSAVAYGAHEKATTMREFAGPDHARGLARATPAVVGGLLSPDLQLHVFNQVPATRLTALDAVVVVALLLGLLRLPKGSRAGLLLVLICAGVLPVLAAVSITRVREFQALAAAVPAVLILGGLLGGPVGEPWYRKSATLALALVFVGYALKELPVWLPFDPSPRSVPEAVFADKAHWPIFVWHRRLYEEDALLVGQSQASAAITTLGRDTRIRALRSCSSAAVREAAATVPGSPLRILTVDSECDAAWLTGRGVLCSPFRPIAVPRADSPRAPRAQELSFSDCVVDPKAAIRSGPDLNEGHQRDHAISRGHDALFTDTAAPLRLGQRSPGGLTLSSVHLLLREVEYRISGESGLVIRILATPHMSGEAVEGTDLDVTPAEDAVPEAHREEIHAVLASIRSSVTPSRWTQAFTYEPQGLYAPEPPLEALHLPEWLFPLCGSLALVFGIDLWRRRRPGLGGTA